MDTVANALRLVSVLFLTVVLFSVPFYMIHSMKEITNKAINHLNAEEEIVHEASISDVESHKAASVDDKPGLGVPTTEFVKVSEDDNDNVNSNLNINKKPWILLAIFIVAIPIGYAVLHLAITAFSGTETTRSRSRQLLVAQSDLTERSTPGNRSSHQPPSVSVDNALETMLNNSGQQVGRMEEAPVQNTAVESNTKKTTVTSARRIIREQQEGEQEQLNSAVESISHVKRIIRG